MMKTGNKLCYIIFNGKWQKYWLKILNDNLVSEHNTHFQKDWNIQGLQKHRAHRFLTGHYSWKETYM